MAEISKAEIRRFLMQGTFTGKLATVKKEGGSHVVPIWFVVDDRTSKRGIGDIVFTTGSESIKAKNIRFDRQREVLRWATKIAERYMGKSKAKAYGKRNSGEGEVLVRITPTRILAVKDIVA